MKNELFDLSNCYCCPRECGADRFSKKKGFCNSPAGFSIGSICIHRGEEPPISGNYGICNIFFTRCNLQCIFCQNYQISSNKHLEIEYNLQLNDVINLINDGIDKGADAVGFVSPSHFIPQMKQIISEIKDNGKKPIIVMNTNAYDKQTTINDLEDYIDIYLPDFKYSDNRLALRYSKARNYTTTALDAIAEMYRQKGSNLFLNENGYAENGLIVRHLVLPGEVENSINCLRLLADRIGTSVHLSLMSQYNPPDNRLKFANLNRKLFAGEYELVVSEAERLGFYKGWFQEMDSATSYNPNFREVHPFAI